MANPPNIQGPGMIDPRDGRLSKRLVDWLLSLESRATSTETSVTNITNTVNNTVAGTSGDDLLAAMYGTHGVQIFGSIASGVEIRGSDGSGNIGAHIAYGV